MASATETQRITLAHTLVTSAVAFGVIAFQIHTEINHGCLQFRELSHAGCVSLVHPPAVTISAAQPFLAFCGIWLFNAGIAGVWLYTVTGYFRQARGS